jgi:hypothetical protein
MTPSLQDRSRNTIAATLGISTAAKELSLLATLLGGLSQVSVRSSSIHITVPAHLVRADIEPTLKLIPGVTLSGDETTIIATRSTGLTTENPLLLQGASLPALTPTSSAEPRAPMLLADSSLPKRTPKSVNERTRQRASQLLETLGLSSAEAPNYLGVLAALDKAANVTMRETKNTRSDGFIVISVETQSDATSLLAGLGFSQVPAKQGNLWAGLSYQRICHTSETKACASVALTARGCDVTIEYGEPLTDSRTITRDFTAIGSGSMVD